MPRVLDITPCNLYGANGFGGANGNRGTIFQFLIPSQSGWTLIRAYRFFPQSSDGYRPYGVCILHPSGNVYGTTTVGGSG